MKEAGTAIERFAAWLKEARLDPSAEDIADILWLSQQMGPAVAIESADIEEPEAAIENVWDASTLEPTNPAPEMDLFAAEAPPVMEADAASGGGVPFRAPAAQAIRSRLDLARALRPLMRKVPSITRSVLDEEATAASVVGQISGQAV